MSQRITTTLPCQQLTVGDSNYDVNRLPITGIILHTIVGTIKGADARFNDPKSGVSAQYGVGYDGKLYQWVDEDKVAYQAGNYHVNQTTIGIEHEDMLQPNADRPDALYQTSAKLVADICTFYNIPCDADHIKRHQDVIDKTIYPGGTACPDSLDTNRIIKEAAALLHPGKDITIMEIEVSDFLKLRQKSESLDTIGTYLSYDQALIDTLGFGTVVVDKIKQIQTSYNTIKFAYDRSISTKSAPVLQTPPLPNIPIQQANNSDKAATLSLLNQLYNLLSRKIF